MLRLAGRDLLVLFATALVWSAASGWDERAEGLLPAAIAALAGMLLGLAWGYAAHEWGHLAGARLARSRIHVSARLARPELFDFRTDENTRAQFLCMAWGGLALLWTQAAAFAAILRWDSVAAAVASGFAVLGALFTTWVEAPIATRVALGGPLPNGGTRPRSASEDSRIAS